MYLCVFKCVPLIVHMDACTYAGMYACAVYSYMCELSSLLELWTCKLLVDILSDGYLGGQVLRLLHKLYQRGDKS